ncbi:futalosine hydrolase [Pedobacter montanisoli]|uniref:Futalosine hydrolase n=1 Tax=Pedobacter montanisoli TaxID=2923277 RepID=A0ABS9ZUG5_9SPHI|nr:futalosine hydrolase [Pedobacter montanisoli]MCJ0741579.1 futalosine hydrolase [Pedobacter montanisoli]
MKLLIVVATRAEIAPFLSHFNLPDQPLMETADFDVLVTGVGMVATAFALGQHLDKNKYNRVLNVGIAGSFDRNISLGELVNVSADTFAELGAEDHESFIGIENLGFGKSTYQSTGNKNYNLKTVNAITVNKVHGNADSIAKTQALFAVQTESMEGAAVFYACSIQNISCIQIRAISNYVEPRNRNNWEIGLAVKNLNDWLLSKELSTI